MRTKTAEHSWVAEMDAEPLSRYRRLCPKLVAYHPTGSLLDSLMSERVVPAMPDMPWSPFLYNPRQTPQAAPESMSGHISGARSARSVPLIMGDSHEGGCCTFVTRDILSTNDNGISPTVFVISVPRSLQLNCEGIAAVC
jgi:hypothetical protein